MHRLLQALSGSNKPESMSASQEKYGLLGSEDMDEPVFSVTARRPRSRELLKGFMTSALVVVAVLSLGLNVMLSRRVTVVTNNPAMQKSEFAGLTRNTTVPIYASTQYGPAIGTQDERNAHWEALDISHGVVALSDEYAREHRLPLSQRFPWDQTKGIYLLGAFHTVHCLQMIQKFSANAAAGGPPDNAMYHHVEHCLDVLLQDAMCHADDTPWYELPPQPERVKYAAFQARQCKSWDALLKWADEHDACFKYEGVVDANGEPVTEQVEHYSYCKQGSPYVPAMREYFGRHPPQRAGYNN